MPESNEQKPWLVGLFVGDEKLPIDIQPPKTNIAPENRWLGDYFFGGARPILRGYVCFREGIHYSDIT